MRRRTSRPSHVLDGVRKKYETDRQPETLQEASKYLGRLTGGRYKRICRASKRQHG